MIYLFNLEPWLEKYFKAKLNNCKNIDNLLNQQDMKANLNSSDFILFSYYNPYDLTYLAHILDNLELLIKFGIVKKIIFLSSFGVYAPKYGDKYKEVDLIAPRNRTGMYAITCEHMLGLFNVIYEIDVFILRLFNLYGPMQNDNTIIPSLFRNFLHDEEIHIGDLKKIRDFLYIDDLLMLIECITKVPIKKELNVYNAGTSKATSVKELISKITKITKITDREHNITFDASKIKKDYDYDYSVADTSKVISELNWKPNINFKEGLNLYYQWLIGKRINV